MTREAPQEASPQVRVTALGPFVRERGELQANGERVYRPVLHEEWHNREKSQTLLKILNEGVLCRLLLLLERQERCYEAWQVYSNAKQECEKDERRLTPRVRAIGKRVRAKLVEGEPYTSSQKSSALSSKTSAQEVSRESSPSISALWCASYVSFSTFARTHDAQISTKNAEYTGQAYQQVLSPLLMLASTVLMHFTYEAPFRDECMSFRYLALEEVEAITTSYWRLCTNASLDLVGSLAEHFRLLVALLQRTSSRATAQRVCSLTAEVAQLLGKTLFDGQEYELAWSYYIFSLKAAQAASNSLLWAVGIGRSILLLTYWKKPQKALPLLQEVRQVDIHNTRVACWLLAVEAEVHAHLGNAQACELALKTAKEIIATETFEEDAYATGFSASRLAGYEGACLLQLRRPAQALPVLHQALSLLEPQAFRRQSTLLADIGLAYTQQGNIEQACQHSHQAFVLTCQTKSRAVLERLGKVHSELKMWKETNEVKQLEKHLTLLSTSIM